MDPAKKYDTVVTSGQATLRALLTLNGGASIAFLAFIGGAIEKEKLSPEVGSILVNAMQGFIAGTFLSVCAFGSIFLTNCLSSVNWKKASDGMFVVTLVLGTLALAGFFVGSYQAINAFSGAAETIFRGGSSQPE